MARNENKTQPTGAGVDAFLDAVADPQRRADCAWLRRLMSSATGAPAEMWGPSIVGFGRYRYRYASGREGEWMLTGFSPRKNDLTIYVMPGFDGQEALLSRLGKHRTGKSCLYLKRLADVDLGALEALVRAGVEAMASRREDP